ncbi:MAG: hypothetical protein LQ345_004294 [Seirophora villosa]|nr:MAG: hypothetical protein LQ345_004294 [Seirophora villosa]
MQIAFQAPRATTSNLETAERLRWHGYHFLNVERRTFLQAMFDRLPEKNVVKPHHHVTDIIESEDGVRAILANGTEEQGDVIVGCDGVNSIVRQAMWANANKMMPGFITLAEKRSMAPTPLGLGTRDMTCVHEHGFSFLFLTQPNHVYFFVFSKLAKQLQWPENRRWTDKDAEGVAEKVRHHPISDGLLFGELWRTRIRSQLVSVEEGIFDHWHFGRSVLVGDAAHKMTPNFALGGNSGMESVAVLTNELHRLARTTPNGRPTQPAITATFQRYQQLRSARVRKIHFVSGFITRLQAFDGVLMRFTARYVVPLLIGDRRIADQLGYLVRDSPKLDFIPLDSRKGTMAWNDERRNLLSEDDPWQKKKQNVLNSGPFIPLHPLPAPNPKEKNCQYQNFHIKAFSPALTLLRKNQATNMKAVIIKETGKAEVADIKPQSMRPNYIRVKTVALALNPSCDLSGVVDEVGPECRFSDVKKGDKVFGVCHCGNHVRLTKSLPFALSLSSPSLPLSLPQPRYQEKKQKRNESNGANPFSVARAQQQHEDGAYAEFAMVKDGHLAKIPEGMGFEETASMGAGVTTVGQALYHDLKLPWPTEPAKTPFPILIYGGSTATGSLAIQYAKL